MLGVFNMSIEYIKNDIKSLISDIQILNNLHGNELNYKDLIKVQLSLQKPVKIIKGVV